MAISARMEKMLDSASWVRRMFEEGARLKARHGDAAVADLSLGNPVMEPPERFNEVMRDLVESPKAGRHRYMPNAGYPSVRKRMAEALSGEHGVTLGPEDVVMTCGAAGGLNVILKALLDPEDEVICPSPYFVEYGFYCENHGGRLVPVETRKDFSLDLRRIKAAIGPKTKAVLINSPHNPTGQVYSAREIAALATLLDEASQRLLRTIYLISDEPYRRILYGRAKVPSVLAAYPNSLVAYSWSKELAIPGERIGYVATSPNAQQKEKLFSALALANRVLGFVNAPALMQRAVARLIGVSADFTPYRMNRDLLCDGLEKAGYRFIKPKGGFYLFPESPIANDIKFVKELAKERVLCVPGAGFGKAGYFRIAFCVERGAIERALPGFAKVMKRVRG